MENMDKMKCEGGMCGGCSGGSCGCGMGHMGCYGGGRHHLIKMILKIIIVALIFWCGFKLGLITGEIRSQLGGNMRYGAWGMMQGDNAPMMPAPGATTVPVK